MGGESMKAFKFQCKKRVMWDHCEASQPCARRYVFRVGSTLGKWMA
ncbi:hypothetical protein HanPI659440_Chr06g0244991 [Helianthus annuus]|nr:hypothetical protein HanPI659440_Chr06g0244991 [Helianthus annuus]